MNSNTELPWSSWDTTFNNKIQHSLVTPSFHHLVMETERQAHLVDKETQVWAVNICIKIARLGE